MLKKRFVIYRICGLLHWDCRCQPLCIPAGFLLRPPRFRLIISIKRRLILGSSSKSSWQPTSSSSTRGETFRYLGPGSLS